VKESASGNKPRETYATSERKLLLLIAKCVWLEWDGTSRLVRRERVVKIRVQLDFFGLNFKGGLVPRNLDERRRNFLKGRLRLCSAS
jgi:hypothetical protein